LVLPANIQSYVATPQPASAGSLDAALRVIWRWTSILRWAAPLAAAVCAVLIFAVLRKGRWLGLAIGALIGAALTFAAAFL
ncbi:hypothetical protein, partial [Enterococcus faecium]|uniref:hypothetical protein n=1 Tax=Enterococcus faecium TaxID=1352 RepID=UPI003F444D83